MKRHWSGYTALVVVIVLCTAFYFTVKHLRQARKQRQEIADAQANATRLLNPDQITEEQRLLRMEQIERIKPKLHILSSRLRSSIGAGTSPGSVVLSLLYDSDDQESIHVANNLQEDAIVDFLSDPARLFDKLDANRDEILSYSELNALLQLDKDQLQAFVAAMNEASGVPDDTPVVFKDVFCGHFLNVLEKAACVSPTSNDARLLFREVADKNGVNEYGEIAYEDLYESSLGNFLSDSQVYKIIRYFRAHDSTDNNEPSPSLTAVGRETFRRWPTVGSGFSMQAFIGGSIRDLPLERGINQDDFIASYPAALQRVMVNVYRSSEINASEQVVPAKIGLDIAFENLSLTVKKGATTLDVVDRCTGRLQKNTMTAIMGGSGAGKTSLLNALCGRASYGQVTGNTWINGNVASIEEYQSVIGFVPQDDIVFPELTVRENFVYSGQLRLPRETSLEEIHELAEETIAALGLRRVADNEVGDHRRRGLSGGERKRVNIGLELMAKPLMCFLDEPTSGLDSYSALLVMSSLRYLVENQGVTVAAVIHQPRKSIFDLFDSLILLGVGGKTMYHGPASRAEEYFNSQDFSVGPGESLADWLIDISSGYVRPQRFKALHQPSNTLGPPSLNGAATSMVSVQAITAKKVGLSTGESAHVDAKAATLRREELVASWREHFDLLPENLKKDYIAPSHMKLPVIRVRQSPSAQFRIQTKRIFLLWKRNLVSKAIDFTLVVAVAMILALFSGISESTVEDIPRVPYEALASEPQNFAEAFYPFLPALFAYATRATAAITEYALMLTVVVSILEGVSSVKALTEYRDNFFREASSGVNITSYFLSVNFTMTLETTFRMVLAAIGAHWARQSVASAWNYVAHFIIIGWLVTSWALIIPIFVSGQSVTIILVCLLAFFGVAFTGTSSSSGYPELYGSFSEFIGGFFAVIRYAIEAILVGEQRCLMPQSGFTIQQDAVKFPMSQNSFEQLSLAQNDIGTVIDQSCDGWYWGFWRGLLVGIALRFIACGLIHVVNRRKQGKKPLRKSFHRNPSSLKVCLFYAGCCLIVTITAITLIFN